MDNTAPMGWGVGAQEDDRGDGARMAGGRMG